MIQKIAILIVAGGNSSRLGSAKQLLPFQGKTLLRRIVDEACLDPAHSVYVVLGAEHQRMQEELLGTKATAVLNKHWMEGMSSSISVGIHAILKAQPELSHCIIAVCD